MKRDKVNVKIVPDVRRSKNDKRFPLKLRITYKGKCKFYATGYDASDEEWMIINSADAKNKLRKIKNAIAEIETSAEKCCEGIVPFSFKQFEYDFFDQKIQFETVESAFMAYINQLRSNNQVGSAHAYGTAMNSLKMYKANLKFTDITPEFLQNFENWMVHRGKSITTVGIYLRQLRAIINIAKENGVIRPQDYPFGRRKYIIPGGRNMKKALNISQIKQIFEYPASPGIGMDKARDFWILSYLCNGINMMDLVQLQWRDLTTTAITFVREKTKRTNKANPVTITVPRNEYINRIISKWGIKSFQTTDYVFGIIARNDSAELIRNTAKQFT